MKQMRSSVLFVGLFFMISGPVFAQASCPTETKPPEQAKPIEQTKPTENKTKPSKPEKKSEKPKPATYLKVDLIHGDFGLYGYDYYFNDLNFEIENHWSRPHGGFAGFSVGYRKEDFSSSEYGHFINGKVFWKAEGHGFYFKPGVGAEWGKPSPRFEQTHFHYNGVELISYERIYLERNAWMPVGTKNTGMLNPFFELGIGQKAGLFLFEGGTRIGYNKFVTDTFQFKNGSLTFQGLNGQYKFVPTLYIGIGLKLF